MPRWHALCWMVPDQHFVDGLRSTCSISEFWCACSMKAAVLFLLLSTAGCRSALLPLCWGLPICSPAEPRRLHNTHQPKPAVHYCIDRLHAARRGWFQVHRGRSATACWVAIRPASACGPEALSTRGEYSPINQNRLCIEHTTL